MPISNQKGLDALRALSQGGTPALDAYRKAQTAETTSRTDALNKAIGGQDLGAAVAKAQAQYAPKVPTAGLNVNDLSPAADNYLSQASAKLGTRQYEDQQNLMYQAEALRRKENELTAQERAAQLQGAADLMGEQQTGNLAADAALSDQLGNLGTRKAMLREQLTAFDAAAQKNAAMLVPAIAAGSPQAAQQMAALDQQRGDILRQMAGLDEQYKAASGQYAGFLGTDAAGLQERYAQADTGNVDAVKQFLGEEGMRSMAAGALSQGQREIEMGTQGRLRALAPAFGIDPLTAAGQFREGEGNDLARQGKIAQEGAYVAGDSKAQQAEIDEQNAGQFGFASGADFNSFKKSADLGDQEIQETLSSPGWSALNELADNFLVGAPEFQIPGTDKRISLEGRTGRTGLTEAIKEMVNDPSLVGPDGNPLDTAAKSKLIQLASRYYGAKAFGVEGKGEGTE